MKPWFKLFLYVLLTLSSLCACTRKEAPACAPEPDGGSGRVSVRMELGGVAESSVEVKTPALSGSEDISSGATAYVFYSESGMLDSVQELSLSGTGATISLPYMQGVDIYVLGNYWAKDAASGARVPFAEALGDDTPVKSSDMDNLVIRIDGSEMASGYLYQTLEDVKNWGIPFAGCLKGYVTGQQAALTVDCKRLFARLHLTIDHSGLEGSYDLVRNVKLHVRQTNARLLPFAEGQSKALVKADIIEGDYDPSMSNAAPMTFDFYLPENMQGDLLAGNTDQTLKSEDRIVAQYGADKAALLSYVEFHATLDPSEGGYGGDVAYRFYLGYDVCTNFDIERNRNYNIRLGFKVNSLFDPYWQVVPDLQDNRSVGISADSGFSSLLPEGQMVAVRKNRPGKFYVYVDNGKKLSMPAGLRDASYEPSGIAENSITTDFLSESNVAAEVPKLAELSALGITPSYDASTGCISFTVTDASKFKTGKEVDLTITTVPKGKSCTFKICTYENMSLSWREDKKLYVGMGNTLDIVGYAGQLAFQTDKGIFKFAKTLGVDTDFVPYNEYMPSYCKSSGQEFSIYRYYDDDSESSATLRAKALDSFNDGNTEAALSVPLGICTMATDFTDDVNLDVRGTPHETSLRLKDKWSGEVIPREDFEDFMFDRIYGVGKNDFQPSVDTKDDVGGDYVKLTPTDRTDSDGYVIYQMYRSRIGDRFKNVGGEISNNQLSATIRYGNKGYTLITSSSSTNRYSGKETISFNFRMLPFVKLPDNLALGESYDDYTLCSAKPLDGAYVKGTASMPYSVAFDGTFHVDEDYVSFYAKPLAASSCGYSEGVSASMKVDCPSSGTLSLYFEDGSETYHSAGPHSICAGVTNIHSGEKLEVSIGETDVFVHFVVGLMYDMSTVNPNSHECEVQVFPMIYSDLSRTSFGMPGYNSAYNDSFEVDMYYGGNLSSKAFSLPGAAKNENCTVTPTIKTRQPSGARIMSRNGDNFFQIFVIEVPHPATSTALNDFVYDLRDEDSDAHRVLAGQLTREYVGMQFANPVYWEDGNTSSSAMGIGTYDRTAFGDLYVDASAAKDSAGYKRGYYVFNRLGDLKSSTNDWIPYFKNM